MSQRTSINFGNSKEKLNVNQDNGNQKLHNLASVVFNPNNLKMYHILFIILFILYIWLVEFSNVALIIKSLFMVALIALIVVESVIILLYVE